MLHFVCWWFPVLCWMTSFERRKNWIFPLCRLQRKSSFWPQHNQSLQILDKYELTQLWTWKSTTNSTPLKHANTQLSINPCMSESYSIKHCVQEETAAEEPLQLQSLSVNLQTSRYGVQIISCKKDERISLFEDEHRSCNIFARPDYAKLLSWDPRDLVQ